MKKIYKNKCIEMAHDYFKEIVYQAANLEDKNITYSDTLNTIDFFEEAIKTIPYRKIVIISSLKKAYEYIIERANSDKPVTYKDAMKLNEIIDSYEKTDAGFFRNHKVMITGTMFIPPLYSEQESIDILNMHKQIKNQADGARLCAYWSKRQLFGNGNKRTAICFANLCLLAKGLNIILIGNRTQYGDALVNYYNDENKINEFINYVLKSSNVEQEKTPSYKQLLPTTPLLSMSEQKVMSLISNNKGIKVAQMAIVLDYSVRQVQRIIKSLVDKGNIKRIGSKKKGSWIILSKPRTI